MFPSRHLASLSVCLLLTTSLSAQRNLEMGVQLGVDHFSGDLGNWDGAVQWNGIRPAMSITFRDYLNNPKRYITRALTTETRISWHRLGYNELAPTGGKSGVEMRNYRRGLNFRNDLFGISQHLVLNMYREPFQPLYQQRFFAFSFVGVGLFYGRPKADLFHGSMDMTNRYYAWADGTIRDKPRGDGTAIVIGQDGTYETDLYSWVIEGDGGGREATVLSKPPSPWHVGVPIGFGMRYMVTREVSVGMELSYYMFFTDMLDAVSNRYATYAEIGQAYPDSASQFMARYISDPTGWGTNGEESIFTSRRGNPGLPDSFSYLSVEVCWKFKRSRMRRSFVSL
ncbi:MAG: hypothetical protein K8H89_12680 [Flavobacteriales bacterium]|jgi:hypothetical protein|nr:hypothetical protein [Flavobacteriales bacterium]MCB0757068.1 hypothetical protein [Flavobacteriales bacterium]